MIHHYYYFGGSILRRMLQRFIRCPIFRTRLGKLGAQACVGGQTIEMLRRRIKKIRLQNKLLEQVNVVLVGTNNILKGDRALRMIPNMRRLIKQIQQKRQGKVLLCTLPPLPKATTQQIHQLRLFNYGLQALADKQPSKIRVVQVYAIFQSFMDDGLFERDGVHPNAKGLSLLYNLVTSDFF